MSRSFCVAVQNHSIIKTEQFKNKKMSKRMKVGVMAAILSVGMVLGALFVFKKEIRIFVILVEQTINGREGIKCELPEDLDRDSATYTVNPKGGTICSLDRKMWLQIPPGAVTMPIKVKITSINKESLIGLVYDISPTEEDVFTFLKPVIKSMDLSDDSYEDVVYSDPKFYERNEKDFWVKSKTSTYNEEKHILSDFVHTIYKYNPTDELGIPQKNADLEKIDDWKTYTNEIYGYTLQYPSNWKFADNVGNFKNETQIVSTESEGSMFIVTVVPKDRASETGDRFEDYNKTKEEANPGFLKSIIPSIGKVSHFKDIVIDGASGFAYDFTRKNGNSVVTSFIVERGNYQYKIKIFQELGANLEETFSNILSTFKFIK